MRYRLIIGLTILAGLSAYPQSPPSGPSAQSPAARKPPAGKEQQSYPAAQIHAGESRFVAECGFCHGRDGQGGETGPDLTRSALVAEDVRGDKLKPVILAGRPAAGMPGFSLPSSDMDSIVAFIHDARSKVESESGNRRSVTVDDLQTGNAEAGKRYFEGPGGCARCHAINGSFATIGGRLQGLALLQRMLYPRNRGARAGAGPAEAKVIMAGGQTVSGKLAYRDEFSVTLVDANGWTHTYSLSAVKLELDDPLKAHADQLGKYTDQDMHNVFAYLQTLK